jgi:redox-sensitive bicupin YhaK (pirin superfamily)
MTAPHRGAKRRKAMITLRKSADRGLADHGWLRSRHSFSFAEYHDPEHMGWGNLRVINDDVVAPGTGFGTHGHRDMEIVSYVLEGELAHKDSMGNGSVIVPGDVQRMSAGRGVTHSEFNHASGQTTHFLQIWILPSERNTTPSYEQKRFEDGEKRGKLRRIASPVGADGAVRIGADATIFAGLFDSGQTASLALDPARKGYVHVARGTVRVNGIALAAGDAAKFESEASIAISDGRGAEVLVFDLAA